MSIVSVMPSSHLILCHPLLLLPSIFPSIRVFSNESVLRIRWPKYWSFRFSISPSNEYSGLISFRMYWLDLLAVQGTLKRLKSRWHPTPLGPPGAQRDWARPLDCPTEGTSELSCHCPTLIPTHMPGFCGGDYSCRSSSCCKKPPGSGLASSPGALNQAAVHLLPPPPARFSFTFNTSRSHGLHSIWPRIPPEAAAAFMLQHVARLWQEHGYK